MKTHHVIAQAFAIVFMLVAAPQSSPAEEPIRIIGDHELHLPKGMAGKTLIYDFTAEWCPYAVKMDELLMQWEDDPNVIIVQIDVSDTNSPVYKQFKFDAVPWVLVYDPKGNLKANISGYNPEAIKRALPIPQNG